MSFVSSILLAAMLSMRPGTPLDPVPAAQDSAPTEADSAQSAPSTASGPTVGLARRGAPAASPSRGWPMPVKVLLSEAAIAALASCGHVAHAVGEPPESGAYALGSALVALGGAGAVFVPWALAAAGTEQDRRGAWSLLAGCVGVVAAGGYDLYLHASQDPSAARIFRDNMIALNAVPLLVWGVDRLPRARSRAR